MESGLSHSIIYTWSYIMSKNNQNPYTGYVYLWYDTVAKFFYVGGHYGKVEDSYVCSNKPMKRAYKLRPETFRFKVLEYINGDTKLLRSVEQHWLDMIKDCELMISENVQKGTCKYYNVKKTSAGGSHKGHKKNRTKPSWNKGITADMLHLRKNGLFCLLIDKPKNATTNPPNIAKLRNKWVRKTQFKITCKVCNHEFLSNRKERSVCSLSCVSKIAWINGTAKPGFVKGKQAWNKGLSNPLAAENGRKGAEKNSKTVTGRRRKYNRDGSWIWEYPS
ncbi:hypothetical protein UFOVP29_188 [uncultured Caudovirales phage]|uniref:Nuclease associated modular domain 3 n=1 Tax=uncultured Caudovirales phage TaxID=2100421 RepID=A0A6J5KS20_9CAUD|nr:hypothetical protein UFOVP29_188 [uncultured Caudovirales phage]